MNPSMTRVRHSVRRTLQARSQNIIQTLLLRRALQPNRARLQQNLPRLLSRTPPFRPLLRCSARSGLSNRDRIADAADLTTVVDAADAIAVGAARVAGVAGNRAAIYRHRNTLRQNRSIPARANRNRTNRLRLIISRLFFRANRSPNIKIAFPLRRLQPRLLLNQPQARRRQLRNRRHQLISCATPRVMNPLCGVSQDCRVRFMRLRRRENPSWRSATNRLPRHCRVKHS